MRGRDALCVMLRDSSASMDQRARVPKATVYVEKRKRSARNGISSVGVVRGDGS